MAEIKDIYNDAERTEQIYPRTHEKAVVDSNGATLDSKLELLKETINQKQMAVGAVTSDTDIIKNSTNLVIGGGLSNTLGSLGNYEHVITLEETTLTSGYINSTGGVSTSTLGSHTDFIPIESSKGYFVRSIASTAWYLAYYSSANENSFISYQEYPNSPSNMTDIALTIPNGAKYFRATIGTGENEGKGVYSYVEKLVVTIADDVDDILDSIGTETIKTEVQTTYTQGYINSDGTVSSSTAGTYTDFIQIDATKNYLVTTRAAALWHVAYYRSASESTFISAQQYPQIDNRLTDILLVIPNGATHFRATVTLLDLEGKGVFTYEDVLRSVGDELDELKGNSEKLGRYANINKIGFLGNPNLFDADLLYVPMYGQSYSVATDGEYKITSSFDPNVYMHAASNPIGKGDTTLRRLATTQEYTIADFGDIFSKLIKRFCFRNQDILVGSYGQGSRSVMELSPDNGYGTNYHAYETIFEAGVANAVGAANAANKTIKCPFILYLQGESDIVSTRTTAATSDSWCKGDKDLYKQYMGALKTDMQQTIMEATGQTEPPIVFVYTAGNQNFNSLECGIQQAVLELCEENDDMFTVGSYYYMTSMGAHLSPDGRRWLAELFAKQVFETIVQSQDTTMKVKKAYVKNNSVYLQVKTPEPPLTIDTWTDSERTNYGFMVYKKNENTLSTYAISSVNVGSDVIELTLNHAPSSGDILLVTYGNTAANGGGNVRDSGAWRSYYLYDTNNNGTGQIVYIPKDENGNSIVGKKYPMQSWMPQFGIEIEVD